MLYIDSSADAIPLDTMIKFRPNIELASIDTIVQKNKTRSIQEHI